MGKVTANVLHFAVPAVFVWALVILGGSLIDVSSFPLDMIAKDKLLHAIAYGFLAWLIGFSSPVEDAQYRWLAAVGLTIGFGGIVEILQAAVHRQPSLGDCIADLCGAFLLAGIGWLSESRTKSKSSELINRSWS